MEGFFLIFFAVLGRFLPSRYSEGAHRCPGAPGSPKMTLFGAKNKICCRFLTLFWHCRSAGKVLPSCKKWRELRLPRGPLKWRFQNNISHVPVLLQCPGLLIARAPQRKSASSPESPPQRQNPWRGGTQAKPAQYIYIYIYKNF